MPQYNFYPGWIQNSTSLVGLRSIANFLGAGDKMYWDNGTATATFTYKGKTIEVRNGVKQIAIDGKAYAIPVAPSTVNNTMFVPIAPLMRAIGENTGDTFDFKYNGKGKAITLTTNYEMGPGAVALYDIPPDPTGQKARYYNPQKHGWDLIEPSKLSTVVLGSIDQAPNDQLSVSQLEFDTGTAKSIRENTPRYKDLFGEFGLSLDDATLEKIINKPEDSRDLLQQIYDMENLRDFGDIHRFYAPDTPFTLDLAKQYKAQYQDPGGLDAYFKAKDYVNTHYSDDQELMNLFGGGYQFTKENYIDVRMGKPKSEDFKDRLARARAAREGALSKDRAIMGKSEFQDVGI